MKNTEALYRRGEQGFTLVELAVVMIIIGLLIGGILKGQELIENARVTTTASQMEGMGAATDGFFEAYNALPGDMATASTRLRNCNADPCDDGDGNGVLENSVGEAPTLSEEGTYFFNHLLAADFITGLDGTSVLAFGNALPTAPIGGGFMAGDTRSGAVGFAAADLRPGVYVFVNAQVVDVNTVGSGSLSAAQAANIDRRLDDGVPNSGIVVADSTAGNCKAAAGDTVYDESNQGAACSIAYRVQ